ncbi:MAG: hypothetical protein ACREEO_03325 [Phenylobacterium sp.]
MPPSPTPDHRLPLPAARLEHARRFPGCALLLVCGGCGWRRRYDPLRIAHRLYTLGDGGLQTPAADVAKRITDACQRCGARSWETCLAYPPGLDEREAMRLRRRLRD